MSKIAFVADVHVGNHKTLGGQMVSRMNERCRETIAALKSAAELAAREGCAAFAVLGDLFDNDAPPPPMVAAVLDALKAGPQRVILLEGNHDQHSTAPRDHSLASLDGVHGSHKIDVISRPTMAYIGDLSLACVPFRTGNAATWFEAAVAQAGVSADITALCFHLGVSDDTTKKDEPWMMGSHDQVSADLVAQVLDRHRYAAALCGNWHKHMMWTGYHGEPIVQVGALVPTGFNNLGGDDDYGSVVIWDGRDVVRHVVPGPRYFKVNYRQWLALEHTPATRARVTTAIEKVDALKAHIAESGKPGYYEVLANEADVKRAAQTAASNAVQAAAVGDNPSEGLAKYVKALSLPAGTDADSVLAAVHQYLRRAGC